MTQPRPPCWPGGLYELIVSNLKYGASACSTRGHTAPSSLVWPANAPQAQPRAPGCPPMHAKSSSRLLGAEERPPAAPWCLHDRDSTAPALCRFARLPYHTKLEPRAAATLQPHLRGRVQRVHGPPLPPRDSSLTLTPTPNPNPNPTPTPNPNPNPTPTPGRRAWRCCSRSYSSWPSAC